MANQQSRPVSALGFHHISVQTNDLANSTAWYKAFFGTSENWSLETFSDLTIRRLPGIRRIVEMPIGDGVLLHLFQREGRAAPEPTESVTQFQHVCMAVRDPEDLIALRERWIALFESGRFSYTVTEEPSPVVVDAYGIRCFYAYDVNGLEWEFTYVPPTV
jgi:catechol 2,3-dioxygenase-like lactoylglutathione lyase family enzyme